MLYRASDVAKWFLARNAQEQKLQDAEDITNLKLQKLLYYAQGLYLGLHGRPLFDEDMKAWTHGPVVPEVYHEYKTFGGNGIKYEGSSACGFSEGDTALLEYVYDNFGQYTAWKLRNMTHEESPWMDTPPGGIISKDLIQNYFKETYVEES